ncbi:hypothetical protein F5884DRAFT_323956 [Xylogone sp. PMI_703]|nr:hypothetical protein F5884DRAFT_323956 [Xylogone sp. PMI_703]
MAVLLCSGFCPKSLDFLLSLSFAPSLWSQASLGLPSSSTWLAASNSPAPHADASLRAFQPAREERKKSAYPGNSAYFALGLPCPELPDACNKRVQYCAVQLLQGINTSTWLSTSARWADTLGRESRCNIQLDPSIYYGSIEASFSLMLSIHNQLNVMIIRLKQRPESSAWL